MSNRAGVDRAIPMSFGVRCPRCQVALTERCPPGVKGLCNPCEVSYFEAREKVNLRLWFVLAALVPFVLLGAALWHALSSWHGHVGFRSTTPLAPVAFWIIVAASGRLGAALRERVFLRGFLAGRVGGARSAPPEMPTARTVSR